MKLTKSTGNVFADLGFAEGEAGALLQRSRLMVGIIRELRRRGQTQQELGRLLGIGQSRVSDLMKGKAKLFSLETLIAYAQQLGMDAQVVWQPTGTKRVAPVTAQVVRPTATVPAWATERLASWPRKVYAKGAGTSGSVMFFAAHDSSVSAKQRIRRTPVSSSDSRRIVSDKATGSAVHVVHFAT